MKLLVTKHKCSCNICDDNDHTPLHFAVLLGHSNIVKFLLPKTNINVSDHESISALDIAARTGNNEILKILLDQKCVFSAKSKGIHERTALHHACNGGHLEMVDTLIRAYDSDLQATDNEGLTPLHVAAGAGRKYIVEKLIKVYKCPVDSNNSDGFTPLAVAAMAGECEIVKVLIGFGANVHFKVKKTNFTVLGIAASLGHTDIVSFLVNNGHCNPCKRDDKGKTALFYACKSNNVSLVETMITEYKCNISAKDDNGMYPLHIAVREGSMEVVQHLVKYHNCDVDIMDNDKNTPLIIAAGTGNSNMVRMLISTLNANINKTNQEGGTAFEFAALNGHEDVVDLFIKDFDTKPQCRGINGRTALHHACNGGHISLVNKLIEVHKCSPTERDWKGVLPLHLAAGSGKVHVVELLVNKHKCDVDCIDTERETPLMYAARRGNNDVVKILITELKAKKDILNYQKLSALDFAVLSHHIETANVLLKLGCDPQPTHAEGMTLLHYACICGEKDFVRQLIHKYKLSVDIADKHKRTPLMLAAQNGECDVVKMLISELNANKNKMDEQDSTALHIAAHSGQMKIVKVLIEQFNCDISSKGFEGKTPLHYACYGGHFELAAKLITEYKCNPHAKDRVGFTPITLAVRVGHADVISALIKYGCPAGLLKVQYKEIERLANKKLSIRPCMKVFVMGDKKVGKSTLIEAVRLFSILKMTSTVKTVPPDTVGIVPVEYNAPFGKIVLYDFAGDKEFHSSHTAVLEKGIGEQIGVFIIVFNLKQYERDKIKERCTIDYWITFLSYACQQYRKSDTYKVNCDSTSTDVVSFSLVGSHSDEVEDASGLLKEVEKYVTKKGTLKDMKLNLRSCIAIDCRMNRSDGLIKLRGILFEAQHNLKIGNKENSITVGSNFLLGVLEKEFRMKGKRVCQVKDLRSTLTSRQLCISFEYSQIDTYLEELYKLSLIFYIKNEMDTSCGWVILDLAILLKDIIGDLLNPESPLYKKKLSKFGIVEEDDLKGITNISTEVVVGCLKHLEFCHEIDIDYIIAAHVQENAGLELPKKKVLFFPALLQVDLSDESDGRVRHDQNDSRQKMKWVLSTQSKEYSIITLGCYECVEQTSEWYFPPRFLHVLLLRLGLGFAEKKRSSEPQNYSFIWKNGIHWSTESVEVVVEVVRNNKGVLMLVRGKSSYEDKQIMQEQVISTMVSVIQEIRAAKSEFCDTLRSVSFIVKLPAEIQTDYIPEIHQFHIFKITEIKNTLTGSNNEENTIYCSCTDHKEEKGTLDQRADEISLLENAKYWGKKLHSH